MGIKKTKYGIGGFDPTKPNNNLVEEIDTRTIEEVRENKINELMTECEKLNDAIALPQDRVYAALSLLDQTFIDQMKIDLAVNIDNLKTKKTLIENSNDIPAIDDIVF